MTLIGDANVSAIGARYPLYSRVDYQPIDL